MGNRLKIVVTGASGFIGRHVLDALLNYDVSISAVTRDRARLRDIDGRIAVLEGDIAAADAGLCQELAGHDVLLHLAWDGLPNYRSLRHFEQELPAQYGFLRSVITAGLKSLVVTGTCFEYGMQSGKLSEDLDARPDNPYGFAKDALRKQLVFLKQTSPFNLTWARLFYMYGQGQAPASLYSQLESAAARGERRFNMSGGEQLRDFLAVTDVAARLAALALQQKDAGIVNVCSGRPRSVRALVEGWMRENDWHLELNLGHFPYPDYEPLAFWGDNTKFELITGQTSDTAP